MRVCLVNSMERQCGCYQFGEALFECISKSQKHAIYKAHCSTVEGLTQIAGMIKPDLIVFNYHPSTMPWFWEVPKNLARKQAIIKHEPYHMYPLWIDATISQDPNPNPYEKTDFNLGRPILDYERTEKSNEPHQFRNGIIKPGIPTIGSFGFGTPGKGFLRLVEQVKKEFEVAHIRLLIPFAKFGDESGTMARETERECLNAAAASNVMLSVSHDFIESQMELLDWLAQNTLNAFLYDDNRSTGISQAPDWAIMARRPVALSRCQMFRSYFDIDGIFTDKHSLKEIIAAGIEPLKSVHERWSPRKISEQFDKIVDEVCSR